MATRVLIVLDGTFRFDEPAATTDFTYTTLVNALTSVGMQVTKAHRQSVGTADIPSFNFATSVNLLDFDAVWLIGFEGRNVSGSSVGNALGDTQRAAIARYMDAGGGVFATGDHDSIGADMCGYLPRVRAMRSWYGAGDSASPMPAGFPPNFPPFSGARADTTRKNPLGDYDLDNDNVDEAFVWFENQSDSVPQPITPTTTPAHPILRTAGRDIVIYPDHMHEGNTLGEVAAYDYAQTVTIDGQSFVEFPVVAGHREMPAVIATGQTLANASRHADSDTVLDPLPSDLKTVNTLSVYDGRVVGAGRVVTGSTFHHYVDINLTGDTDINTAERRARTGPDAEKGKGFNNPGAELTFADIKAVFVNITEWIARPRPALQLILERNTFGQDEATADPNFEGAILVTVDGLKPNQFPGGGIATLSPTPAQLAIWAPAFTVPSELEITCTSVDSDDPSLPDRLQRFTFTYRVRIVGGAAAFSFAEESRDLPVTATLSSSAVSAPLTDSAVIQLTKSANPFMLDLADGSTVSWLSSDLRVFRVVEGETKVGQTLPVNANRDQALTFIRNAVGAMTVAQFTSLTLSQGGSALSPFPTTTTGKKVYNFAVARVRLNSTVAAATAVRVFFRTFTSQTTAALTYQESPPGTPIGGYKKTAGSNPIALPGVNGAGTEWLSFPFFSAVRNASPASQTDLDNVKPILAAEHEKFFGALIDNNLTDPYLPPTPTSAAAPIDLPTLMMGEHQCLVAQIEHVGTPIPSGANPATSDKLSQRNLALSEVANPGLNASRVAMHTFEIEATPHALAQAIPPDELLLEWARGVPDGTEVRIFIPTWNAGAVVELADRFYPRHEIRALDTHTISVPGGGVRYVPIPRSVQRQTGVVAVELPLGIKKGQRFDLGIRQVTNRSRGVKLEPRTEVISLKEAEELIQRLQREHKRDLPKRGVFNLGDGKVLITDLSVLDAAGDHAIIVEHPDPENVAAAQREARSWRETIGSFQLGVPVSTKDDMLAYHLRLLSVFRWRLGSLRRNSRWYRTLTYYVDLLADKVRALGGDPFAVPASPDGAIKLPPGIVGDHGQDGGSGGVPGLPDDPGLEPEGDDWLSETNGLDSPDKARAETFSGKVSGLLYDHFGDFEGFTLEAYGGSHHRFFSRESAIRDLAREAWTARHVVTVITVSTTSRRVRRLLIRGYAG